MRARLTIAAAAFVACAACGSMVYVPRDGVDVPVHGGSVAVYGDGGAELGHGELLAVDGRFVWLAGDSEGPDADEVRSIGRGRIERVEVLPRVDSHALVWGWAGLGMVSTLSHGWVLFATAPAWVLAGGIASAVLARQRRGHVFRAYEIDGLWVYARFPAGLPPSMAPERAPPAAQQ